MLIMIVFTQANLDRPYGIVLLAVAILKIEKGSTIVGPLIRDTLPWQATGRLRKALPLST